MRVNKFLIIILLLFLAILQVGQHPCGRSLATVYAQGPGEGEEPVVFAPSGRLDLTFERLGYDTRDLSQDRSTRYYSIDLPGNFQISETGNYLDLLTSHLPETPDKPSFLKVKVNEKLLSTLTLTETNAISSTVRLDLPEGFLQADRNSIAIELDTGGTCEDPGAFLEVLVDKASTLSFGYQQNPYLADLALYPFPFTEKSLLMIPVTMILPDHPTSDELSAAATVAAGLGQMSGGDIDLMAVLASDLAPDIQDNNHLIVIGKPDDNPLLNDLALPLPIDSTTIQPSQGLLEEILSPWNEFRLLLAVSGLDGEGVLKAGEALNRQAHFLGMQGPVAIVVQLLPVAKSVAPPISSMTLASLGYEDEVAYGPLPQDYTFDFTLPFGWQLEEPPFFVLKFTHADILDPVESVIDITLNNVPIGSMLMDDSNFRGELTVSLPGHLLKSGSNRLTIGVEMKFPGSDDICKSLENKRAWTVISSESEIFLPYSAIDLPPDLRLFPYPFSQVAGMDQTLFVLPDQPTSFTVNDLIKLAVRLGSASGTDYVSANVAYASEVDETVRKNHHLILLGRPTENALFREVNAHLPHPFMPDSDILEPLAVDSVAFVPDPNRDAGLLEIATSPWNEKYSLLAVAGTTDEGVRLAVQTLLANTNRLKGNLAVVEPTLDPFSEEPSQVSTYAIDTRPPIPVDREVSTDSTISGEDWVLLGERWWR